MEAAHFSEYQQALNIKKDTTVKIVNSLREKLFYEEAKKKYSELQDQIEDFNNAITYFNCNLSDENLQMLEKYFKERLSNVDDLARQITNFSNLASEPKDAQQQAIEQAAIVLQEELHITSKEANQSITSVRDSLGDPLANEMLRHLPENTELTKMLKELVEEIADKAANQSESSSHAIAPAEEEESALDSAWKDVPDSPEVMALHEAANSQSEEHPHVKKFLDVLLVLPELLETKVAELSPTLQPFTTSSKELPSKSTFYVNQEGATCVRAPEDQQGPQPSIEQQQAAAKLFFSSLEDFFGTELIATIVSPEQQEQSLTIEKTQEVFGKIRKTLQDINEFLKTNPLLITPEYIIGLATHPEAAIAARESHEQLGAEGNTWLRTVQEAGLCGMLLSGSKIGLALAGVCTPTLPCVALALGAATVDGYIMGRFIARESGLSENIQQEAGSVGATSTVGSAAGIILQRVAQGAIGAYVPEIISSSVAEYGGSYVAMSLRNAALGGARTAELQHVSDDQQHPMSAEDVISLEPRLARLFGIELPSLSQLITAVLNIPGALGGAYSSTIVPSATSSSSTTDYES